MSNAKEAGALCSASPAGAGPASDSGARLGEAGWEQVANLAEGGFIVLDDQHRVVHWNAWMARHSAITEQAARGQTLQALFGPHLSTRLKMAIARALDRGQSCLLSPSLNRSPLPLTTLGDLLDARTPILQGVSVKPFNTGGKRHCLVQVSDMSHTALRERALRHQAIRLAQVVEDLKAARDAAHQANLAKSQFITNMSHELRTPLNSVIGFAQLLQLQETGDMGAESREFIGYIRDAGEQLLKMVADILDLSRLEIDRLLVTVEPVEVERFLTSCIKSFRPQAQARGIILEQMPFSHPGTQMQADPVRLAQIMSNLLSNAIKYNVDGGRVIVMAEVTPAQCVRITVTDTGPGVPLEREHELFQSFNRLGAEYTEIPGAGIGLTLSRNLARLLGGDVGYSRAPEQGAVFWVDVPVTHRPARASSHDAPRHPTSATGNDLAHLAPFTLLYVDNNLVNIRLLEALFATIPQGRLITARSAEEALRLAHILHPRVIVLDVDMPRGSGLAALERLHTAPETQAIPVVALSTRTAPEDMEDGRATGFCCWLTRPLDMTVLMETLAQIMAPAP